MREYVLAMTLGAAMLAQPAVAGELTGTLKKLHELGAITIGHRESSIPFSYYDDKQQVIGYSMDICAAVVDAIKEKLDMPNLRVELTPVTSANRIPLLANGTVDLECGSTANLKERNEQVAFSNTYYVTYTRFLSKKSANFKTVDDLAGKAAASTAGTGNLQHLIDFNEKRGLGIRVMTSADHAEGFLMLETDRIAAFVLDDVLLASLAASSKDPGAYVVSSDAMSDPLPYGAMVRKDDPDFLKLVNDATAALYTSGKMQALYDKWFMQPIPPHGVNLNLPMDPVLKKTLENPTNSFDPANYK